MCKCCHGEEEKNKPASRRSSLNPSEQILPDKEGTAAFLKSQEVRRVMPASFGSVYKKEKVKAKPVF